MYTLIFRISDPKLSDTNVLYNGINVIDAEDEKDVFRVKEDDKLTEKFFRTQDDPNIKFIQIKKQITGEVPSIPPPRIGTMFFITGYEKISNPIINNIGKNNTHLFTGGIEDKQGFFSIKSRCDLLLKKIQKKHADNDFYELYDNRGIKNDDKSMASSLRIISKQTDFNKYIKQLDSSITKIVFDIHGGFQHNKAYTFKSISP